MIDATLVGETYAPVVLPTTVMLMANLAAIDGDEIASADIEGAYLLPEVDPGEPRIFMRLNKRLAGIIARLYPKYADHGWSDGTMLFELGKYLYGLPQSGNRFYRFLSAVYAGMGFVATPEDQCLFVRGEGAQRVSVGPHVDDMFVKGKRRSLDGFFAELQTKFRVTIERGPAISFIGLLFTRQGPNDIVVAQTGYRRQLLSRFARDTEVIKRKQASPAAEYLTRPGVEGDPPADRIHCLSILMSIMFLARLTRADILFVSTFLATKMKAPTHRDYLHLCRLLRYISDSPNYGIRFRKVDGEMLIANVYTDMAEHIYPTGHGHGGVFVTLGSGYIGCRSARLSIVTLSSKEGETYVAAEGGTWVRFIRAIVPRLGHTFTVPVRQWTDNTGVIADTRREGEFGRNKHVTIRKGFMRELVARREATMHHLETARMPADMLTKALVGEALKRHIRKVGLVALSP